jgi:hypothetical protein
VLVVDAVREADLEGCMAEHIWKRSGSETAVRPLFRIDKPMSGSRSRGEANTTSSSPPFLCGLPHPPAGWNSASEPEVRIPDRGGARKEVEGIGLRVG